MGLNGSKPSAPAARTFLGDARHSPLGDDCGYRAFSPTKLNDCQSTPPSPVSCEKETGVAFSRTDGKDGANRFHGIFIVGGVIQQRGLRSITCRREVHERNKSAVDLEGSPHISKVHKLDNYLHRMPA